MKEFTLLGQDNLKLRGFIWDDVQNPKGIVQISHGMAEHISRYDGFAQYLNAHGYKVYGHDHRGHGASVKNADDLGYFSDQDGWTKLVDDLFAVNQYIRKETADLPLFIFGHSMGSFALRHYLSRYGNSVDGAIICGTGQNPVLLNQAALLIAKLEKRVKGARHRSKMLTDLSFGSFNSKFKPNRTEFDWLSRDEVEVDKYIQDPLCGMVFTTSFYVDFLGGLIELSKEASIARIPKEKPYLFISGESDPLSDHGKAIESVASSFKNAGISDVNVKIYPSARHELTNEMNRNEIYGDVVQWLDEKLRIVHK